MVRLLEAQLHGFGKFQHKHIAFSDGLQIFYGANEAGKSTLQLFLRVMLYGMTNQRKTARMVLRDRERVIPWGERYAQGVLKLSIDGKEIEIHRQFGKTPAGDKLEVRNARTGELLPELTKDNLGEQLFGVSQEVFEKTFWMKQDTAFPIGADETLNRRLMNLKETGEEDVSVKEALRVLESERKLLQAKDKRGVPGVIDVLREEREAKVRERFLLLSQREQKKAAQVQKAEAEKQLQAIEKQLEELQKLEEEKSKLRKTKELRAKLQEAKRLETLVKEAETRKESQQFALLSEEMVQTAEFLKRKLETLDQTEEIGYDKEEITSRLTAGMQRHRNGLLCMLAGAGLVLLSLILGVLRVSYWLALLLAGGVLGLVLTGIGAWLFRYSKKQLCAWEEKRAMFAEKTDQLRQERTKVQLELETILAQFACQSVEELRLGVESCRKAKLEAESYRNACQSLLAGESLETLEQSVAQTKVLSYEEQELLNRNLVEEMQQCRRIQMATLGEIKEMEGKLSYVFHGGRNPADVESEIQDLDARLEESETRLQAVELAASVLEQVYEERKSDFTPELNAQVTTFLGMLLSEKYQDVRVSDTYQMHLPQTTGMMEAEYFSRGTYEQLYLSLRLALGTLIGKGTEPLFLDDILVTYDDVRARNAVTLLKKLGEQRQILLFTCHERVREFGKVLSVAIYDFKEEMEDVC